MRRRFRREIRKKLAQNVPPVLQEAHFVFDKGEYGRAAELFEQIAQTADARGARRAPLFHLQAGRARVLAGQSALGIPSLKRGLALLEERRQIPQLERAGTRVVAELRDHELDDDAAEIESWLRTVLPSLPEAGPPGETRKRPMLPTHCASCGAGVRPDEVEWLDDTTAECAYCGSPVRQDAGAR